MAEVETVVLVCDVCSAEGEGVETHSLTIDGRAVEVEACARDWTRLEKALLPVLDAGRRIARKRRKRAA